MSPQWTGSRIASLALFRERKVGGFAGGLGWHHLPFIALYVVTITMCLRTIGEQFQEALAVAEEEGWQLPYSIESQRSAVVSMLQGKPEDEKPVSAFGAPAEPTFSPTDVLGDANEVAAKTVTLPWRHLPGFWPLLYFGITLVLHALLQLLQVWSVSVRCAIQFSPVTDVDEATHIKVVPQAGSGTTKTLLLPVVTGQLGVPSFEFHRRKYIYDYSDDTFIKIRCQTALPMSHYRSWRGIPSKAALEAQTAKYGPNRYELVTPKFLELYKQQLLSPFTVFQLFSTGLWLLDDYWKYSMFTLFMICTFEATAVQQRLRSIKTLKGMGMEAIPLQVYRVGQWVSKTSEDLLPGDIFSLQGSALSGPNSNLVPCDCLVLRGSLVVNESSLTGESIPQMKEGLESSALEDEQVLSLKASHHKVHVLYGGTTMLTADGRGGGGGSDGNDSDGDEGIQVVGSESSSELKTPDGGCLACVLRTGFASSQGKLVRMIEGSQESVRGDVKDTSLLLLLLLVFAVCSSGYVLHEGMKEGAPRRSRYQLLLHCILIITSVIPPELPMQMALAVNSSLMTLMKMHIFCTEPFRIPEAGKVDVCLFDKTGTITTDELVAVGVAPPKGSPTPKSSLAVESSSILVEMLKAPTAAKLVIAACHSLVSINDKVTGDPVESAALKAIKWDLPKGKANTAAPCMVLDPKAPPGKVSKLPGPPIEVDGCTINRIHILARHHFSSALQRMSVVAQVPGGHGGWVLVKGSPEAISKLLRPGDEPADYFDRASRLAKEGMRVLALAVRKLSSDSDIQDCCHSRSAAEGQLCFAGFVAFACRVRKDSASAISALRRGGNVVAMITGDALLTALHVAKDVGMMDTFSPPLPEQQQAAAAAAARPSKSGCILTLELGADGGRSSLHWHNADTGEAVEAFSADRMASLALTNDLAVTGKALEAAIASDAAMEDFLHTISVYARMTPDAKERVIIALKARGRTTLMCGDGANDVGALKQAQIGVALLSGFGDINVQRSEAEEQAKKDEKPPPDPTGFVPVTSFTALNALRKMPEGEIRERLQKGGVDLSKFPVGTDKVMYIKLYVDKSNEIMRKKTGAAPPSNPFQSLFGKKKPAAIAAGAQEGKRNNSATPFKLPGELLEELETEGDVPMVKLGDASVAAPFTSKMPSIQGAVDIIRQGRCTLVTSIQMYQILALNCLNSAYSLSVLYLDGVKYGDSQMTALGMLMSISFITISRAKPLESLSPVRPLTSIFQPALFLSISGQFVLHLSTMMYSVAQR
jgi:cation-transporting ATPase 13A1